MLSFQNENSGDFGKTISEIQIFTLNKDGKN